MASKDLLAALLAFALSLCVYVLTLAPTVTGEDSGELITAAYTLGIAHPPGYPLWCLLGKCFTIAVPVGSVAYRVNLLSATLGALSASALSLLALRFLRKASHDSRGAAVLAALLFAFSRDFWAQSVVAEVYSLNVLLFAIVLLLTLRWDDTRDPKHLFALTFVYGLSLTNHSTMAPLGILLAAYVVWRTPWVLRRPLLVVSLVGSVLAGMSLFFYLPLRSLADPAMDWGNPETFGKAFDHVLRRQYAGVEGVRPRVFSEQLVLVGHFFKDFAQQFTPFLFVFVPLGAWRHFRVERRTFYLVALLFLVSSYGIIWLFNYPAVREDLVIKRTFFLPAYALATIWMALGLATLTKSVSRFRLPLRNRWILRAAWLGAVSLPLGWFYSENDKSDYYIADDYARNVLKTLKPDAVFVPTADHATFTAIYLTSVEGLRPDILIADKYGTIDDALLQTLFETDPRINAPPPKTRERGDKLRYLVENCRRPVYVTVKDDLRSAQFQFRSSGLLYEAVPVGERPSVDEETAIWARYEWHQGTFADRHRDYTADMILADYHFARGRFEILNGEKDAGIRSLVTAARHAWGIKEVLNNLGGHLAESDLPREAIQFLLAAWRVEPGYSSAGRNLAIAFDRSGEHAQGLPWFVQELETRPTDSAFLLAAARGARALGQEGSAAGYYLRAENARELDLSVRRENAGYLREIGWDEAALAIREKQIEALVAESQERHEALAKNLEEAPIGSPEDELSAASSLATAQHEGIHRLARPPDPADFLHAADPLQKLFPAETRSSAALPQTLAPNP